RGRGLARPHVDPHDAVDVTTWVRACADLVLERALLGLAGHVHAAPGHVELPAVVRAAEPALLVSPEEEGGAAMRTVRREHAHAPFGVAEGDEILAEEADFLRRPVGRRQLGRREARPP